MMNAGFSGCGLLIMGALAAIFGENFGFIGIFIAIVVVCAISSAFRKDGGDE